MTERKSASQLRATWSLASACRYPSGTDEMSSALALTLTGCTTTYQGADHPVVRIIPGLFSAERAGSHATAGPPPLKLFGTAHVSGRHPIRHAHRQLLPPLAGTNPEISCSYRSAYRAAITAGVNLRA